MKIKVPFVIEKQAQVNTFIGKGDYQPTQFILFPNPKTRPTGRQLWIRYWVWSLGFRSERAA